MSEPKKSWEIDLELLKELLLTDFPQHNILWTATEPDGNCMYRALARELLGDPEKHRMIRILIVRMMKKYMTHWQKLFGYTFRLI